MGLMLRGVRDEDLPLLFEQWADVTAMAQFARQTETGHDPARGSTRHGG
jgi:hypothetical protein